MIKYNTVLQGSMGAQLLCQIAIKISNTYT